MWRLDLFENVNAHGLRNLCIARVEQDDHALFGGKSNIAMEMKMFTMSYTTVLIRTNKLGINLFNI